MRKNQWFDSASSYALTRALAVCVATNDQFLSSQRSAGNGAVALALVAQKVVITVAGNTTVKGNVQIPAGSIIDGVSIETPVAISGTPTSCLTRVGVTDTGQEIVADVDAKTQAHIAATIVAALDKVGQAATTPQTIYVQTVTSGGTASAGTINVLVRYYAPVF